MAVTGLSFGSPTSGAGFDVSATIESLVEKMRKVEDPWSTELASLQKQDTAISSLGSMLSTLSSDIGQLTSFAGVLKLKTGSSSDTSVLQLTAAATSSTAGTHTVVVKNLATTGTGYFTNVADLNDTLSGSITLQVGSNTAKTITLDSSNNTVQGLAKAINQASAGVTASVITDSSGTRLTLVSNTTGRTGGITVTDNSITDTSDSNKALAYTNSVVPVDATLTIDGLDLTSASNTVTNLIPGITFQLLSPSGKNADNSWKEIAVIIANDNTSVESAVAALVTDYNSLVSAINTQETRDSSGNTMPLYGSPTLSLLQQQLFSAINTTNPNGYLDATAAIDGTLYSGSFTIQAGSGDVKTITLAAPTSSLSDIADAINAASAGVTAKVVTSGTSSTIALYSQTFGSSGDLTLDTTGLQMTSPSALSAATTASTGSDASTSTLSVSAAGNILSGSISIKVGSGTAQSITIDNETTTLTSLADAINSASLGVTASITAQLDGSQTLTLTSGTTGSAGDLTISSSLYDTTNTSSSAIDYIESSNLNSLLHLGIKMSASANGTLEFDASSLDAILNSDFSGVEGFFQFANSWGKNFSSAMSNLSTSSSKGILSLTLNANSSMEETLSDQIAREERWISAEQERLTSQLNSANQILQSLPSQLDNMKQLYSAITGYNTSN